MKLPKDIANDPRHDAVLSLLTSHAKPLWEKGAIQVVTLPLNPRLSAELRRYMALDLCVQGLELSEKQLLSEQRGLDALKAKSPSSLKNERISRVLFMANDGSERFYRDCESLLSKYKQRLLGCRLDISGDELGEALFGSPKLVRAVLISDKKAVARVLLALV